MTASASTKSSVPTKNSAATKSSASNKTKYLLVEAPDFARDAANVPLTSYLRLGTVANVEHVRGIQALEGRTRAAGATSHEHGAGEDLASLVMGFYDDERNLCDPPELDEELAAAGQHVREQVAPSAEHINLLVKQVEAHQRHEKTLDDAIEAVLANPQAWLDNLLLARDETEARMNALFEEMGNEPAPEASDTAARPPAYCVPGHGAEADEAVTPYRTHAERRAESERLYARGGWRDHTDGNRISTTRGDKVEVVRGNYRMIVLGRHDQPCDAVGKPVLPGWDISGGHVDETSVTQVIPESSLSWTKRWNGTWHAFEKTIKGDTRNVNVGDSDDVVYGHWQVSTTGSDTPDPWHTPEECPGGLCRTNPKILDETWAEELVSGLGSHDSPIAIIEDVTHTSLIESETQCDTMQDDRMAENMSTSTRCRNMSDVTNCGAMVTRTVVDTMRDDTRCDMMSTIQVTGLRSSVTIGNSVSTSVGLVNDVSLGNRLNLNLAASLSLSASLSTSLTIGSKNSMTVGVVMETSFPDAKQLGTATRTENNLGGIMKLALLHKTSGLHVEVG